MWDDYFGYIVLDLIYFGIVFDVRVCVKLYYFVFVSIVIVLQVMKDR